MLLRRARGWAADGAIDRALLTALSVEGDQHAKSVIALSLAIRGAWTATDLADLAAAVADAAHKKPEQWSGMAAIIAVLLAAIASARDMDQAACRRVQELIVAVSALPDQKSRMTALARVMAEYC